MKPEPQVSQLLGLLKFEMQEVLAIVRVWSSNSEGLCSGSQLPMKKRQGTSGFLFIKYTQHPSFLLTNINEILTPNKFGDNLR